MIKLDEHWHRAWKGAPVTTAVTIVLMVVITVIYALTATGRFF